MATETIQISCINKSDRQSPHERIKSVGGVHNGKDWKLGEDAAIAGIKSGQYAFWTAGGGVSVWVVVALHLGREYLKTEPDGVLPDNLLKLPECP